MSVNASKTRHIIPVSGLILVGLLMTVGPADSHGETVIALSTGDAWTHNSDVQYAVPEDTNLTYNDVKWDTEPFEMPPYYGVRVTHWLHRYTDWGLALDFTHAKMISDRGRTVQVVGERDGMPVDNVELLGGTFNQLEFSDGHNLFTLNVMRRWHPLEGRGRFTSPATAVYVGGGLGFAMPHVEVVTADTDTMEYQLAGPAAQLVTGISVPLGKRFSVITEYRFTYAEIDADLKGGGSLTTDAMTHHLNVGIGFGF